MSYGTLIQTVTVGAGGAASIDFTSIPGTYTDLVLVASLRDTNSFTSGGAPVRLNGVSSSIYTERFLGSTDGNTPSSGNGTATWFQFGLMTDFSGATANTFSNAMMYIPNYTSAVNKSVSFDSVTENNATAASTRLTAGVWASTATITSLSIFANSSLAQYSTASLYGLLKGSGGASVA